MNYVRIDSFLNMGTETNKDDRNTPEYLAQLLKDKKQIQALPNVFIHTEKILDEEINRVRLSLFHHQCKRDILDLPEPQGPVVQLQEKLFVPVKEYPDFNFVGRILGPRGMTAKELEQFTGCKIMVRGKGSMRDKAKEDQNRGKANWEHLNEDLHVLITVEDTRNRGEIKLQRAKEEVKKLLVPAPDGEDDLKKRQLMELAIMNGTYREAQLIPARFAQAHLQLGGMPMFLPPGHLGQTGVRAPGQMPHLVPVSGANSLSDGLSLLHSFSLANTEHTRFLTQPLAIQMRTPTPTGAPIILAPRLPSQVMATNQPSMNGAPPPLVSPSGEHTGLVYNPYAMSIGQGLHSAMDPYGLASGTPSIFEYQTHLEQTQAGGVQKIRRTIEGVRAHPYTRVSLN
ncbi:KH domain-containing RNA-binding protein QKI-like isoform X2 [Biomphalaria glabrata]|uniref:KH domain-containing RNA-binding protein QKI-like isoform X2 n=2 Tax=Biomphalaria glabrata TaxID=6526 RepID=A0A9U8EK87_BIOGL|nr:KH domain-containing RNA-binding protein QKI-like isoform X2 [Biomphalaria glabrata]